MATELIITKGLPASGKSTWAKQLVATDPRWKRVNKDSIRAMLGGKHSKAQEKIVLKLRNTAIIEALGADFNVIVDDTNLAPQHESDIRAFANANSARFSVNDSFLQVPLEECIRRDLKREASVGKDVITQMWIQFIAKPEQHERIQGAPNCILVDLDGTLALFSGNPYDRAWNTDKVNTSVKDVMDDVARNGDHVIIMSGRSDKYRTETVAWLNANDVHWGGLWMRGADDVRRDTIVKRELFDKHIRGVYNVRFVIDDRPSVVRMWRHELGLTVFQVAPDIEF